MGDYVLLLTEKKKIFNKKKFLHFLRKVLNDLGKKEKQFKSVVRVREKL